MNKTELADRLVVERYVDADRGDPATWWSAEEVTHHRQVLRQAIGVEIRDVATLLAGHRDRGVDWVAVERVAKGEWYPLTRAEKVEACRWMQGHGHTTGTIRSRLRVSATQLSKLLQEAS